MPRLGIEFTGIDTKKWDKLKIDASGLPNWMREKLPAEVNETVFFSAKVSDAQLLTRMHDYIEKAARGEPGYHRDDFSKKMRAYMGLKPWEGGKKIDDITSLARLDLIFEHNLLKMGYRTQYLSSLQTLYTHPAQELDRILTRKEPRNWRKRWKEAGGKFYNGRMIAPVLDPIWVTISRFGVPYPPFDFNSGMGLNPISARDAIRLGVMTEEEVAKLRDSRGQYTGIGEEVAADGNAGMVGMIPKEVASATKPAAAPQAPQAPQKAQEAPEVSLDDIPYTLDVTSPQSAISVAPSGVAQPDQSPTTPPSKRKKDDGWKFGIVDGLMASLAVFFGGTKIARSQNGREVIYTGEAGGVAAQAHDSAQGNSFTITNFTPKDSFEPTVGAGNSAFLALRGFDKYVFAEGMPRNEAQICAMVLRSPTRVSYNKTARRFVVSKQCGEMNHYVVARPAEGNSLLVSYGGERLAKYD